MWKGASLSRGRRPRLVRCYFAVKAICMDRVANPIGHVCESFESRGRFRWSIYSASHPPNLQSIKLSDSPPLTTFHAFDHHRTLLFHFRDIRNLHETHSPSYSIMSLIHDHDDFEAAASFGAPCSLNHDDAEDKQSFEGRILDSDLPMFALAGGLGNPRGLPVRHTRLIYAPFS